MTGLGWRSLVRLMLCVGVGSASTAAELDLGRRYEAQATIERLYYAHQLERSRSFDEAVPQAVIENKVHSYLQQTAALEQFWQTPVTGEALAAELRRIARNTRFPARLQAIFQALGNDPVVVQECLSRPALVDRLSRNFFAFDERIHDAAREEAEALAAELRSERLDPLAPHPNRTSFELTPAQLERESTLPARPGEIGPVVETRFAFTVTLLLREEPDRIRFARYAVAKRSWDSWWREVRHGFEAWNVRTVASNQVALPLPGGGPIDASGRTAAEDASDLFCLSDNSWAPSTTDAPGPRRQHSATWTGNLMLVLGGDDSSALLNTGWRYDPLTDTWTEMSTANAPPPRTRHTAVWSGSEMLVFGGWDGGYSNGGGRYDPVADAWAPISSIGVPGGREGHSAVWTGSEMIVWGGRGVGNIYLNTGGRYDPAADVWTPTSTIDAPAPRQVHSGVWTGNEMVVWGGGGASGTFGDGGRYDPMTDSWSPISLAGATGPLGNHSAVWTGAEVLIWGGPQPSESGRYDPATDSWTPMSTDSAPTARALQTTVWTGDEMILWGGVGDGGHQDTGGRYDPDSDTWTTTATENAPFPRDNHAAVWTGSRMIVWGGAHNGLLMDSGGRYDPVTDSWTATSPSNPFGRRNHTAVWTGNHMIAWGGFRTTLGYLDTGDRYDPTVDLWTSITTTGAPTGREWHTAIWTGDEMIVWGGRGGEPTAVNTGGRYDPVTDTWAPTATDGAPTGRRFHTAVWTGDEMIVWGGDSLQVTGGRYDPVVDSWLPTSITDAPQGRYWHTAVWADERMVIWGGVAGVNRFDTGGRYDPATDTWLPTSTVGAPEPRYLHTAIWTGTKMVVWGGNDLDAGGNGSHFRTGGRYRPLTDTWQSTTTANAPDARSEHTAVWTGSEMIVWGGHRGTFNPIDLATGSRYEPDSNFWTTTSNFGNRPSARRAHTAVWTGSHMIVWGGITGPEFPPHDYLRDIGIYALGHSDDDDGDGYSECQGDCNDDDPALGPTVPESCDGLDNDCDGMIDESDTDVDADGVGDVCDNCAADANAGQEDGDFDGAGDVCDNCPVDANTDQADLDADSHGDVCDNCPIDSNPLQADDESDGAGNVCDVCPADGDPAQADTDGDGAGDACECQPGDPNDREPAEVGALTAQRSGTATIVLTWVAPTGADRYSVTRGVLGALAPGSYGSCRADGLTTAVLQDDEPPPANDGYFYLVQGQSFDCGLGSLGFDSTELARINGDPGACAGHPHFDVRADTEESVFGTVQGSLSGTLASDDVLEAITEEETSGNPANRFSRLEHRFTFSVPAGVSYELHLEGFRSASPDGDDFVVEYSTDGGTSWNPVAVASVPLADDDTDLIGVLPPGVDGILIVRIMDTDRTPGNRDLDTISLDEVFVRSIP